jgi:hypothetical protein
MNNYNVSLLVIQKFHFYRASLRHILFFVTVSTMAISQLTTGTIKEK